MSKELKEIKRKIEAGRIKKKQEAIEAENKSRQRITTSISSALDKKQSVEKERGELKEMHKRKAAFWNLQKAAALILLCLCSAFVAVKAVSEPPHRLTAMAPADDAFSKELPALCESIYIAFRNKNQATLKVLASRLDEEWLEDCFLIFDKVGTRPEFEKATLLSPGTDSELCYAYVPAIDGMSLQYVFRQIDGQIYFEGVYFSRRR